MARISAEEFRARLEKLGGLAGTDILNPTVDGPEDRFGSKEKAPNPQMSVKYRVGSRGEYIIARQHDDGTYEVIEESAGVKKGATAEGDDKPRVVQLDGGRVGQITTDDKGNAQYKPLDVPKAPEPTVTRSTGKTQIGPEGQEMPGRETVTSTQADYDLKADQERRLAQQATLAQAQQAEQNVIAANRLKVEQGQLTAQQARDKVNEDLERIRLSLSAESNALTRRSQDITVRGQDVSAGVSQRGQDMDYESRMAQSGTSLASALLPYWNAPGQVQSTNSLMGGGPPVPTQPSAPPFTPELPLHLAQQARQQMPAQYRMPGAPGQVPQYQMPAA